MEISPNENWSQKPTRPSHEFSLCFHMAWPSPGQSGPSDYATVALYMNSMTQTQPNGSEWSLHRWIQQSVYHQRESHIIIEYVPVSHSPDALIENSKIK